MRLSQLITSIQRALPVTPRHEKWLSENPNLSYTERAKAWLATEVGKVGRDRSASFSASSMGMCQRKRIFGYLGIPESRTLDGRTTTIFHNGTWMHLRWQMAGLSAGWLAQPEVPSAAPDLRLKGTLDGVLDTGEGLELKSINSNGFSYVMSAQEPKRAHIAQVGAYFVATDLDAFSLIYENKDTQDYKEFVIERTPTLVEVTRIELEKLNEYVVREELPEVKDLCWAKKGTEYLQCQYREICPLMRDWAHAQETATQLSSPPSQPSSPSAGSKSSVLRLRRTSSSPND